MQRCGTHGNIRNFEAQPQQTAHLAYNSQAVQALTWQRQQKQPIDQMENNFVTR